MRVLGWDIGGSNTKVCCVEDGRVAAAVARPFEVRHAPRDLGPLLARLAAEATPWAVDAHAVTMTAELSRAFLTKREGVAFVLEAVEAALAPAPIHVFTVDGTFTTPAAARTRPLQIAAANWMGAARLVARSHPDALFVDVGTTTTDIVPIVGGVVVARGRTDPARLASGELLYTGAVRTPVEALATHVTLGGTTSALAAEGFATSGDVHVWRGDLPEGAMVETGDGRPPSREFAGHRLARALCADRELMDEPAVQALADALAGAQVERIAAAMRRVGAPHSSIRSAVVAGLGAFVAARAARAAGFDVLPLAAADGDFASSCAPAAAVALLLEESLSGRAPAPYFDAGAYSVAGVAVETVVKIGGSLLGHPETLDEVLAAVAGLPRTMLIVPGGGGFADAVREADRRAGLGDDAAHWMAVLAMDQYAEAIVTKLPQARRVETLAGTHAALAAGHVPVLAPSRWLRSADPLPHSWDVTSDSIAAWVTGQAGASRLVLVKAPGASGQLTDPYFERALPAAVECRVVAADDHDALRAALVGRNRA